MVIAGSIRTGCSEMGGRIRIGLSGRGKGQSRLSKDMSQGAE